MKIVLTIKFLLQSMFRFLLLMVPILGFAQGKTALTIDEAIELARENNIELKVTAIEVEQSQLMVKTAFDLGKTGFYYGYDENNIAPNDRPLRIWGVSQNFELPTTSGKRQNLLKSQSELKKEAYGMRQKALENRVRQSYYTLAFHQNLRQEQLSLDSLLERLSAPEKREQLSKNTPTESLENRRQVAQLALAKTNLQMRNSYRDLKMLLLLDEDFEIDPNSIFVKVEIVADSTNYLGKSFYDSQKLQSERSLEFHRSKLAPEVQVELFTGSNDLTNDNFNGLQLGLEFPLFSSSQRAGTQIEKLERRKVLYEAMDYEYQSLSKITMLKEEIQYLELELDLSSARSESTTKRVEKAAESYTKGEINLSAYISMLEESKRSKEQYLGTLLTYQLKVSELKYLTDQ